MNPPLLPDTCDDPLPIPAHPRPTIVLRGTHIEWDEFRAEAAASGGPDLGASMTHPGVIEGRSLMPPRRGHVASLMAGGGLDNSRVGDEVVKGYVQRIETEQKLTEEQKNSGVVEIIRTEYEPMSTCFNPALLSQRFCLLDTFCDTCYTVQIRHCMVQASQGGWNYDKGGWGQKDV